jgi:parallel beta-helix repeat protein
MRTILALFAAVTLFLFSGEAVAGGVTFTVNATTDGSLGPPVAPAIDADLFDGVCDYDLSSPGLQCSLRAAIEQANYSLETDTIGFNIPALDPGCDATTDVCVIHPLAALPVIGLPVVIDGTSQPGYVGMPLIGLDGFNESAIPPYGAGALVDGLKITAGNSTVRGLIIRHFGTIQGSDGIELTVAGGNTIQGNFIGTNDLGELIYYDTTPSPGEELGNRGSGVHMKDGTSGNMIGGSTAADRNVISGNFDHGVRITASDGNTVAGNYIGTNLAGDTDRGNGISFPDNGNGVIIDCYLGR